MKTKGTLQLKQAGIITVMLFGVLLAVTGIIGLIPTANSAAATDPHIDPEPETAEVFSIAPQPAEVSAFAGFIAPLTGRITSPYGYRNDPFSAQVSYHRGVDVAVPAGTEVAACADGTVTASAYDDIGGHYVILSHENGTESYYGHLQTRTVSKGDTVTQGDIIGLSGATGKVTGAHLHFQLTYNGRTVDPARYIDLAS